MTNGDIVIIMLKRFDKLMAEIQEIKTEIEKIKKQNESKRY